MRRPQEILTTANAILGQGQLSLAKYLLIVAREDQPSLDIHDIPASFGHVLERVDWRTDLHFQTRTTIDTLDYSGHGLNQGSKVVIAAAGPPRRSLADRAAGGPPLAGTVPTIRGSCCPASWRSRDRAYREGSDDVASFCRSFDAEIPIRGFPLIVIVDDSEFTAASERTSCGSPSPVPIPPLTSRESGHSSTRSTGAAPARWSSMRGSSRTTLLRWRTTPRSNARSTALAAPGGPLHGVY